MCILGRVNVKRLSQWLKGIREDVSEKNPLIPGGVIQIDESMLHYLSKEIKDPSTVLLAPASTFIKVRVLFNIIFHHKYIVFVI